MTKRRDKGDGSLHTRADGRKVASFYYLDVDGRRKRKYVYGKTKTEVKAKLKELKIAYEMGNAQYLEKSITLEDWLEFWFETKKTTGNLRPSTLFSYRDSITRFIVPKLGAFQITRLSPEMIQNWVNWLVAHPMKPRTVRKIYGCLSSALTSAVHLKKIPFNPCAAGVLKPKVKKYKGPVLNTQEAKRLVAVAEEEDSPLTCMIAVAIATGMRKGELRALHWNVVDLDRGVIQVKGTAVYLPDDETGKRIHTENDPKSEAGDRPITLPKFVVEMLRAHKRRQTEQRLASGVWKQLNLVFTTRDGNYYNLTALQNQFKRLLSEAGLPPDMRFHDLRHSSATILFAMKVNPKVVQKRLGHSDIRTTLGVYGQATEEMEEDAMKDFDEAYRREEV